MLRTLVFLHRWMGVGLALLFTLWFVSGIVMMYRDFPAVRAEDRLERSPALDASTIHFAPEGPARLNSFDGRPVYRYRGGRTVYADTGEEQRAVDPQMAARIASAWTKQAASATVETMQDVDQWTVQGGLRSVRPLWKFSWPNGEQVYVSGITGEVIQYTTTASRFWAYLGAIPHWLYFTPLRKNQPQWSQVVIWTSGVGTIAAMLGIAIGMWVSLAAKKIPYAGQKHWHTILGLIFGIGAVTWAFSGMMSMDPFPGTRTNRARGDELVRALHGPKPSAGFEEKSPAEALKQLAGLPVKELEMTSFAGEPFYLATIAGGDTRIVPVHGEPMPGFGADRIMSSLRGQNPAELRVIDEYDLYYLDRNRLKPLPVVLARVEETRYYIDPKTARIAGSYDSRSWMSRWLYHGLHSLDFPWLYKHRPLWDIAVITFMLGGSALCVTSLVLAWRVVHRKLRFTD